MKCLKSFLVPVFALFGCAPATTYGPKGIVNFRQVRPDFYRSGQPTTLEQWKYLHDVVGVTDDFKLDFDNEGDDSLARVVGIDVHILSIEPTTDPADVTEIIEEFVRRPEADKIVELKRLILEIKVANARAAMSGGKQRIALIHCKNGHDRTGMAIFFVRYYYDGWSKDSALKEARKMGFHMILHGLVEEIEAARR